MKILSEYQEIIYRCTKEKITTYIGLYKAESKNFIYWFNVVDNVIIAKSTNPMKCSFTIELPRHL